MTFDINSAIASRDQSHSAEPVQRPFQKAQMTNGRFGNHRELESIRKTGDAFFKDRSDGPPTTNYDLYNTLSPEDREYLLDWNELMKRVTAALGSGGPWYHPMMKESAAEAREEDAETNAESDAKPAEARLDQPDARDSSS